MSKDWEKDVREFMTDVAIHKLPAYPQIPSYKIRQLSIALIKEEVNEELIPALEKCDLSEIADGGIDSIVVILDALAFFGIYVQPIWDEIHRTNMLKKGGKFREDGKLLKPEGWKPPEIEAIIEAQIQEGKSNAKKQ